MAREGDRPAAKRISAYKELRVLIVRGRLAPGSRIIESEAAERFGLSRTPIRSALRRLQQEGYIVASSPGKQTRLIVAPLTRKDARELFNIVGAIEALAARFAAELSSTARSTLVRDLERLNQELLLSAGDARTPQKTFALQSEFHDCYVAATGATRLIALHGSMKPQAERYHWLYSTALVEKVENSIRDHGCIIRSIAVGDADAAQQAVHAKWRHATDRLARIIGVLGTRGNW